jgi:BirA family biotin operon repressor/biotin-[acetyl-CoA-carboxylase] ligase
MTARFSAKALREDLTTSFVGRRLEYRAALGSTQDLARELARAGAAEGTVVLAGRQTAGQGRLGRHWVSPAGGLYLTVVLRPPAEHLKAPVIIAALAVARVIERLAGLETSLKWPNDVLVAGRKIAGILSESELVGQSVSYALVGIGVNVNTDMAGYPQSAPLATSVMTELGREVSREALAAGILNEFEALYLAALAGEPIDKEWRARLGTLGKKVQVRFAERVEEGLAEDVDRDGNLILRRADGSRLAIAAGDVTLQS